MKFKTITDLNNITEEYEYITVRKESDVITGYELKSGLTVYDFKGLTFDKDLYINGTSITVKNAIIPQHQLILMDGCSHCRFENVVIGSIQTTQAASDNTGDSGSSEQSGSGTSDNTVTYNKPLVSFGYGTAATTFDKCAFIGVGDYDYAMDAGREMVKVSENSSVMIPRAVNDTLVMKNCTFRNLGCVVKATKVFNCVIEGCRFDVVGSIIHNDGVWHNDQTGDNSFTAGLNANIVINGISVNTVAYIFRSRSTDETYIEKFIYTFANIVINGMLGEVTEAVVDIQKGGCVNLEYNAPVTDTTKLCSDNSSRFISTNVKTLDEAEHKYLTICKEYTVNVELEPDEIVYPFADMLNVESVSWDNEKIEVFVERYDKANNAYIDSIVHNTMLSKNRYSGINAIGRLKLHNGLIKPQTVEIKVKTYNLI